MTLLVSAMRDQLRQLYNEPARHYHNNTHIADLLGQWAQHHDSFQDAEAVEAAIWFHDAIYDSTAKDNEAQSAELAAKWLRDIVEPDRLMRIVRMIKATAGHSVSEDLEPGEAADTALLLDMDLSILAASNERFDAYEAAIRREYGWVDELAWRTARAEFLRQFIARPFVFHTGAFRTAHESGARANMARALARLEDNGA